MGADYPDGGVPLQRKSSVGVFTSSELPYIPTAIFPHGSHKPKIRVSPCLLGKQACHACSRGNVAVWSSGVRTHFRLYERGYG